jgi:hypothetical protein
MYLGVDRNISPGTAGPALTGGLLYALIPLFPMPYSAQFSGIGGHNTYFTYLMTNTFDIGNGIFLPEFVHAPLYIGVLAFLSMIWNVYSAARLWRCCILDLSCSA